MALSQNSKILVSDINTALSGKIDTAGTGLSKSGTTLALASVVTAGNAGPSANATLAYSGTFTVPYITYDAYGRVTGRTNRTMTMPAAPSGGTATAISNVCCGGRNSRGDFYGIYNCTTTQQNNGTQSKSYYIVVPSGGTWAYMNHNGAGTVSGGGRIVVGGWGSGSGDSEGRAIAIRVA